MQKGKVHHSENQVAKDAAKAIRPKSASLTQNSNIMHLKTKVSDSTHGTQYDQLKNGPPKFTVRKVMEPTPGVAWTKGGGGGMWANWLHNPCHGGGGGWCGGDFKVAT